MMGFFNPLRINFKSRVNFTEQSEHTVCRIRIKVYSADSLVQVYVQGFMRVIGVFVVIITW